MAYELELPDDLYGVHNVFHPWLLHLYADDPLPGQPQEPEEHVEIEQDDTDYDVEEILDARINRRLRDPNRPGKGLLQY